MHTSCRAMCAGWGWHICVPHDRGGLRGCNANRQHGAPAQLLLCPKLLQPEHQPAGRGQWQPSGACAAVRQAADRRGRGAHLRLQVQSFGLRMGGHLYSSQFVPRPPPSPPPLLGLPFPTAPLLSAVLPDCHASSLKPAAWSAVRLAVNCCPPPPPPSLTCLSSSEWRSSPLHASDCPFSLVHGLHSLSLLVCPGSNRAAVASQRLRSSAFPMFLYMRRNILDFH